MKTPLMVIYLDEPGVSGLLQLIEGGSLAETNTVSAKENEEEIKTKAEAGGGFLSVLGLAKISLGAGKKKTKTNSDSKTVTVGPYAHLNQILEKLRKRKGTKIFETLDEAFEQASEEETYWVCVKDNFSLTNTGRGLFFEALNREQKFLFEIDPARGNHTEREDYYKRPARKWHLAMAASFDRCPRLKGKTFGISSHEALYFQKFGYAEIPLNVFGCYLKVGLSAQIIPYAIWI